MNFYFVEFFYLFLWAALQVFLFVFTCFQIRSNSQLASTNALFAGGLAVGKAAATLVNFNCALLILSMCQISITYLRGTWLNKIVPFDLHLQLHQCSGMALVSFSLIHTTSHYINYTKIPTSWLNLAFSTGPGVTGHVLWILLLVLSITSYCKSIKKRNFELFWYIHQTSLVFFLLIGLHGSFCFFRRDSGKPCLGPSTWKWLIGPVFVRIVEFFIKQVRSRRFTFISKVIIHQSNVMEVQIKKPSFQFKPGQYVEVHCPDASLLQWHPFTITSAPEEGHVSIHLSIVGDWTLEVARLLGAEFRDFKSLFKITGYQAPRRLPKLLLDGPYGSVSENFDQFEVAICIGAGIGQTPFASILKSMWYSITHPYMNMKLTKIIFYGISRQVQSLTWFLDILKALDRQNHQGTLELNCYLTGRLSDSQILYLNLLNSEVGADPITGLSSRTCFGRPNFPELFSQWTERFEKRSGSSQIGVFYCGPKVLGGRIKKLCSKSNTTTLKYKFHQETF